ncbi:hypothetical protein BDP27DRAFT_1317715 [Rhodocollybia butyracea]|uniref:Mediator of RNA polymerase II transcription subunit 25 n=1 Tax=Rhodocollybia butyracea TaxID=206335 RepID=A0A9P5Q488_9AGAR|nr:hypothetical protein BDP27DRAFT_1317715 [Rhodocollybia butyracea]
MAVPDATTPVEFGALAIVVDSSVALALNWHTVMSKYLSQFVKRLMELNPGNPYRVAWVTYGPSDCSLPCKRYFVDFQTLSPLFKNMEELGLGSTSGGVSGMAALDGLVAAIELFDILASKSKMPRKLPSHILHITASVPNNAQHPMANNSPALDQVTWETLPTEISKRAILLSSIVLNPKNTKISDLHSSPALNTASTSWLGVQTPHIAYVALLSAPPKGIKRPADQMPTLEQPPEKRHQSSAVSPPRPQNTNIPNTNTTPPTSLPPTVNNQPLQPPAAQKPTQPVGVPNAGGPPHNSYPLPLPNSTEKFPWPVGIPPLTPGELIQRFKLSEEARKRGEAALAAAVQGGDPLKIETIKQEIAKVEPMWNRLRAVTTGYVNALKRSGVPMHNSNILGAPGQIQPSASTSTTGGDSNASNNSDLQASQSQPHPNPSSSKPNLTTSDTHSVPGGLSTGSPAIASMKTSPRPSPKLKPSPKTNPNAAKPSPKPKPSPAKSVPASAAAAPGVGPGNSSGGIPMQSMSPEVAAQMQKLERQHPRDMARGQTSPSLGVTTVGGAPPQHALNQNAQNNNPQQDTVGIPGSNFPPGPPIGLGGGNPNPNLPNQPGISAVSTIPNTGAPNGPAWTGTLFLPGDGPRKDLRLSVLALSANHTECRAHTWPSEMTLTTTRDPVVSLPEFQMWAKKTRPVVCTFKAHARPNVPQMNSANEQLFSMLLNMIGSSKTYFVSSWTLPSGAQTNNVLFAFAPPHGLIGTFFPVTGIQEMPRSVSGAPGALPAGMPGGMPGGMARPAPVGVPPLNPTNVLTIIQMMPLKPEAKARLMQLPPDMQVEAVKSFLIQKKVAMAAGASGQGAGQGQGPGQGQGQPQLQGGMGLGGGPGQLGMPPGQKPGPGGGMNIPVAAAAAMAARMQQSGMTLPLGMQGLAGMGMQGMNMGRGGGQPGQPDGNQINPQHMAALLGAMRGNMGGMGGMNINNMGGMGGGNNNNHGGMPGNMGNMNMQNSGMGNMNGMGPGSMTLQQQMAQMQQMQQNRAGFGGGGGGGPGGGGPGAAGSNLSMDMLQSFMHRTGDGPGAGQGGG